jgi:hypothetical protein
MLSKKATVFAFALCLLGRASTLSVSAGASDIVTGGSGLTLGSGWYNPEVFNGRVFRWVNNDAVIRIHTPRSNLKKISVDIQGGPGLSNAQRFDLHLKNSSNQDIADLTIPGSEKARFDIPVTPGRDTFVKLHIDGGGKKIPKDPRTLNFRVFSVADASSDMTLGAGHPDINSPGISLGSHWYMLEEYKGETFRWVANDAEFTVTNPASGVKRIAITAASGPAVKMPGNWALTLENANGKAIQTQSIRARGTATFSASVNPGNTPFKLHVTSTGAKSPNDPRTLSFRVFKIGLI